MKTLGFRSKNIISILLAIMLIITNISVCAFADDDEEIFTITFIDGVTDDILSTQYIPYGGRAATPRIPQHDGYRFTGWSDEFDFIECDMDIYAEYEEIIYCTVRFIDGVTDEVIKEYTIEEGEGVTAPEPPKHEGYVFTGWSEEELDEIYSDLDVYAEYEEIVHYTVTFIDRLTDDVLAEYSVEEGEKVEAPEPPEHEGYIFTGWSEEFDYIDSDLDVYAEYEEITPVYTVTFVDSLTDEVIAIVTVEEGESAEAPEPPEHDGYEFIEWSKSTLSIYEDITVYALYEKIDLSDEILLGDANEDSEVDSADATTVLRFVAQLEDLSDSAKLNADTNEDNEVDSADATSILRFVAGLGL